MYNFLQIYVREQGFFQFKRLLTQMDYQPSIQPQFQPSTQRGFKNFSTREGFYVTYIPKSIPTIEVKYKANPTRPLYLQIIDVRHSVPITTPNVMFLHLVIGFVCVHFK